MIAPEPKPQLLDEDDEEEEEDDAMPLSRSIKG
jgi:hypothetical protein